MNFGCFIIFVLALIDPDPRKISKINNLKKKGEKEFTTQDYKSAISTYKILMDSFQVEDEALSLNLAHSYFQTRDTTHAKSLYQSLLSANNFSIRSKAFQQLGILENQIGNPEGALAYFKNAIKSDPANEEARYNYEMIKKKLEEKKKEEQQKKEQDKKENSKDEQSKDNQKQQQENKDNQEQKDQEKKDSSQKQDQENKDQQEKDSKEQEKNKQEQEQQENKNQKEVPPEVSEKLKEMKISEEKAKMILEAMKNQEIQYLQQNQRKAVKPKSRTKPDW